VTLFVTDLSTRQGGRTSTYKTKTLSYKERIWPWVQNRCSKPSRTDWVTVSNNKTLTLTQIGQRELQREISEGLWHLRDKPCLLKPRICIIALSCQSTAMKVKFDLVIHLFVAFQPCKTQSRNRILSPKLHQKLLLRKSASLHLESSGKNWYHSHYWRGIQM
jgi:hypothetical protein